MTEWEAYDGAEPESRLDGGVGYNRDNGGHDSEIDDGDIDPFVVGGGDGDGLAYYERDPGAEYDEDESIEDDDDDYDEDEPEERLFPDDEAFPSRQQLCLSGGRRSEEFCELPVSSERRRLSSTSAATSVYRTDVFSPGGGGSSDDGDGGGGGLTIGRRRRLDKVSATRHDPRNRKRGGRSGGVLYPPDRPHPFVDFLTVFTAFMVAVIAAYFSIS